MDISHDFLGIWDCLTSQQVVDVIRYQVSEGKKLSEITEMICDHCLAPDTTSRLGIGCDNMTILVVVFLHGRTKEEWYSWITDRVKNRIGYETPNTLPQLYSPSRIKSFHDRQEALAINEKAHEKAGDDERGHNSFAIGLARALQSQGVTGTLYTNSDEPESLGFNGITGTEATIEESGDDEQKDESEKGEIRYQVGLIPESELNMEDGETHLNESDEATSPRHLVNGDLKSSVTPVEQLPSQPGGDAPASVAKIEGSLDSSEDPFKI